jgi:hypothetical protein
LKAGTRYHWGPAFNYTVQAQVQAVLGRNPLSTVLWLGLTVSLLALLFWMAHRSASVPWLLPASIAILATTHAMYHDLPLLFPAIGLGLASERLRLVALAALVTVIFDPLIYPATHVHLLVLALAAAVAVSAADVAGVSVNTIKRAQFAGLLGAVWKSFEPRRWGSASGSETP